MKIRSNSILYYFLLLVLIATAYIWTVGFDFVWDDKILIEGSEAGFDSAFKSFGTEYLFQESTRMSYRYYRPIPTLLIRIEKMFFGSTPSGYRFINILMHIGVVILLFLFVCRLSGSKHIAFIASSLFSIHPFHTESIVWISGRTDLLAALFILGVLVKHYSYIKDERPRVSVLVIVILYLCAILSKESGYMVIIYMLLLDIIVYKTFKIENRKKLFTLYGALLLATIVTIAVRVFVVKISFQDYSWFFPDFGVWLISAVSTVFLYIFRMAFPFNPDAYQINPYMTTVNHLGFWFGVLLISVTILLIRKYLKSNPVVSFFLLFVCASLIPALNILRISSPIEMGFTMADRFTYLPSAGLAVLLAYMFYNIFTGSSKEGKFTTKTELLHLYSAVALFLSLFLCVTVINNTKWTNEEMFFKSELKKHPQSFLINANMALHYYHNFNYKLSLNYTNRCMKINPNMKKELLNIRGAILFALGERAKALDNLLEANRAEPNDPLTLHNLGTLYLQLEAYDQAIEYFQQAQHLSAGQKQSMLGEAVCLERMNEYKKAEEVYLKLLGLNPNSREVELNYANLLFMTGRELDGEHIYKEYLMANEISIEEIYNFASNLTLYTDKLDDAEKLGRYLLVKDTDFLPAYPLMVEICFQKGEFRRALYWVEYGMKKAGKQSEIKDLLSIKKSEIDEKISNIKK